MPTNVELSPEEEEMFEKGGGLKKRTLVDRAREGGAFYEYFEEKADGDKIEDLAKNEDGREKINKIFSSYFWSMQVESGQRPKKNYASKLKTSIKMQMIQDYKVDITDEKLFPQFARRWKSFVDKLAEEGRADTTHKEEIPATTLEKIYELLWNVKEALENRGHPNYEEKFLSKVPAIYHDKLHKVLQWGAALVLVFYEVRRGKENLDELKASSMKVKEDENFVFKYIKNILSETDKNHPGGTNVRCNGVIPFLEVNGSWNPGLFFEFYLKFLPTNPTKENMKGDWLFPRPRKHGTALLNIHKAGHMELYEPNMKVGPRLLGEMLPALCLAVNQPKCTNHQLRTTAIIFMRRAGLPWLTIAKITGHQSVENLIKYYDLSLEGQGLAEVVGALAQGPAVARGQDHHSIVLQTRDSKRQKMSLKIEGEEVGNSLNDKENISPAHSEKQQLGSMKKQQQQHQVQLPLQPTAHQNLSQQQTSLQMPVQLPSNYNQHLLPPNYNQHLLPPNYSQHLLPPNFNQHLLPPNYNQDLLPPNYNQLQQLSPYFQQPPPYLHQLPQGAALYPQLPGFQPPLAYQFHQVAGSQPPYRGQSLAGCAPTNQGHTVAGSPPNYQHQLSPYYQQQSPYHHQLPQGPALYQPHSGFQPPLAYQFHHMAGSPHPNQVQQVSGVPPTHQGQQVAGAPPT